MNQKRDKQKGYTRHAENAEQIECKSCTTILTDKELEKTLEQFQEIFAKPTSPHLSASAEPIFKPDCNNW